MTQLGTDKAASTPARPLPPHHVVSRVANGWIVHEVNGGLNFGTYELSSTRVFEHLRDLTAFLGERTEEWLKECEVFDGPPGPKPHEYVVRRG